jgi:hypothetical protein
MQTLERMVMLFVLVFVLAVWAVVGFIFWIPLLTRATTVFSAMVVHGTITRQRPDSLKHYLASAAVFYFEGFRITWDVLYGNSVANAPPMKVRFGLVFIETLWTVLFWGVMLCILKPGIVGQILNLIRRPFQQILGLPQ